MNLIHIAGHLGADAEARYTASGKKVINLRVASRTRKGGNDDTIWWRVTLWGDQWDKMVPYLKKGAGVMIIGEFHKPEIFTDREGKPQPSMDITAVHLQFSPFGKPGGRESHEGESGQTGAQPPFGGHAQEAPAAANPYMAFPGAQAGSAKGETFDDEVPF